MTEKTKKPIWKRSWVWVLAILVVVVAGYSGAQDASAPANNKPTINMAEFERLKTGMSYEEVTEIIGGKGKVLSESGTRGEKDHIIIFQYDGEGSIGANANVMFQNNKLNNKAQSGLK